MTILCKNEFYFLYGGFGGQNLKKNLIWSSGGPFVQWSETICAILVKGFIRNNLVKLFLIWTRENVIEKHYLSKALTAPLFGGAKPFVQFL